MKYRQSISDWHYTVSEACVGRRVLGSAAEAVTRQAEPSSSAVSLRSRAQSAMGNAECLHHGVWRWWVALFQFGPLASASLAVDLSRALFILWHITPRWIVTEARPSEKQKGFQMAENSAEERTEAVPSQPIANVVSEAAHVSRDNLKTATSHPPVY